MVGWRNTRQPNAGAASAKNRHIIGPHVPCVPVTRAIRDPYVQVLTMHMCQEIDESLVSQAPYRGYGGEVLVHAFTLDHPDVERVLPNYGGLPSASMICGVGDGLRTDPERSFDRTGNGHSPAEGTLKLPMWTVWPVDAIETTTVGSSLDATSTM